MKSLLLALCLLPVAVFGAFAPNTKGLYDLEQNLSDTAGTLHGTVNSAITYSTTGVWHGTYSVSAGNFTVPASNIGSSGTLEYSVTLPASPANSKALHSIASSAGTRAIEVYYFGGNWYAYGNGVNGTNTNFYAPTANSKYYIKDTWNGTNRQIWVGAWTVAGTVTLTRQFNSTHTSVASPTFVRFLFNADGNTGDHIIDWIRFRDVHDDTATVTVDPTGAVVPTSPYIWQRLSPFITPRSPWSFLWLLAPAQAQAGILDWRIEQDVAKKANIVQFSRDVASRRIVTATPTVTRTPYVRGGGTFTPTATPTPDVSQRQSPTATPTRTR